MIFINSSWYNIKCSDIDVIAFVNATGITDVTIISAVCTLTTSLKNNGLWAKLNAIYPMVGGTAATHKFNLKNSLDTDAAFRLSFIGGITHSSNGVAFGGVNGYADTYISGSTVLTANDNSISYYSRTFAASSNPFAVDIGATPNQNLIPRSYGLVVRRSNNLSQFVAASLTTQFVASTIVTNGNGHFIGSIINSSSRKLYRNGSTIATNTLTGIQSLPTQKIFLGANSNNNIASLFSNRQCAFATIGSGLNDTESANLYTIIQAFQTTLGRQV